MAFPPPPALAYRPAPESAWWVHAAFLQGLLVQMAPRRCGGSGEGVAILRSLAARAGLLTEFDEAAPDLAEDLDLLVLEAGSAMEPATVLAPWQPALVPGAVVLLHGVGSAPPQDAPVRHLPGGHGLAVLATSSDARPATLWALPPTAFEEAVSTSRDWLAAQRLREADAEIAALRRRADGLERALLAARETADAPAEIGAAPSFEPRARTRAGVLGRARTLATHIAQGQVGPLLGGIRARRRVREMLRTSPYFDAAWYAARHPEAADPIDHFLRVGIRERHETSPAFDGAWYLARHPDVAASGFHPLLHYLEHGQAEGRATRARGAAPAAASGADRRLGLHLPGPTLFPVTIGIVAPADLPIEALTQAVAAASTALTQIGQAAPGRILLLGLGEALPPERFAAWPVAVVPPRRTGSPVAGHNRLMAMAFGGGAAVHILLSAEATLHPEALVALLRMVRATGREALVGARRVPAPLGGVAAADALEADWLSGICLAIPRAVHTAIGGLDERFDSAGADLDLCWRAKAAGIARLHCPSALCLDHADRDDADAARVAGVLLATKWGQSEVAAAFARSLRERGLPVPDRAGDAACPAAPDLAIDPARLVRPW
ncbi:hypothetical protein GWK16_09595 [Roseomonas sp. JC162]|uniref:Glycosyltransferase n=1 Tax=Neoroseomonas marina TaxID=1232220 RepID=A0A848EDF5_9PROT|nr:hypothetical protein [Neoroseomonas marina]NMJ41493.1 hypothetical protein [Neoroseomonas marina]